jgi:O-antigen/teichoic acid export membrane protein
MGIPKREREDSPPPTGETGAHGSETRRHLRGSSLLLAGRLIGICINFVVQVLAVRHLSKGDYGSFAYAMSVVAVGAILCQLGLNKGISRLLPILQERRDHPGTLGAVLLAIAAILGTGSILVGLTFAGRGLLIRHVAGDPLSVNVLLVLIALCPLQALDDLFQGILAVFASSRAIFFRRHVLGPLLRLLAVLVVLFLDGGVYMLAAGYLIGGGMGTLIYLPILKKVLKGRGVLGGARPTSFRFPKRELFGFSLLLITSDLFFILHSNLGTQLLESWRGPKEVAEFRAVMPVVGLNLVVIQSLKLLFLPIASRLHARGDRAGLNELYWKSSLWITLFTFPVFACCFLLSGPVTVLLFGPRYADASASMAILACGYFVTVMVGLGTEILAAQGFARYTAVTNIFAGIVVVALNVLLIPAYGAVGTAVASACSLGFYNIIQVLGIWRKTEIDLFQMKYLKVFLHLATVIGLLSILSWGIDPPVPVTAAAIALASLFLVRWNRHALDLAGIFPEISRIPLLPRILALRARPVDRFARTEEAVE